MVIGFFFQAEDGIRDLVRSRGLGDVYKRQGYGLRGTWYGIRFTLHVSRLTFHELRFTPYPLKAVSYTHLTLPTIYSV